MTDLQISEALGMSLQNLTRTYKNSKNNKKKLMYEVIKIGFEIKEKDISLLDLEAFINFKNIIISNDKQKNLKEEK